MRSVFSGKNGKIGCYCVSFQKTEKKNLACALLIADYYWQLALRIGSC